MCAFTTADILLLSFSLVCLIPSQVCYMREQGRSHSRREATKLYRITDNSTFITLTNPQRTITRNNPTRSVIQKEEKEISVRTIKCTLRLSVTGESRDTPIPDHSSPVGGLLLASQTSAADWPSALAAASHSIDP